MAQLKRRLNLPFFTFYGLGSILGAGIYALVGKVAGEAGFFTPVAFIVASILSGLTGFAYAELSARYPKSGGEALYTAHAFGIPALSTVIGLLVVLSAIVSSAALTNAFVGYLQVFVSIPANTAITITVLIAAFIAAWGIKESAFAATILTLIEIGGLLLIIWVGRDGLMSFPFRFTEFIPPSDTAIWGGIMTGAFIAFYAFIGFEDMANVAEEVENPHRNLPLGILIAIVSSTILYCIVAVVAVLSLPAADLQATDAPLALIYTQNTGSSPIIITFIGLFAIVNGLLVQIIMGSRILYGLSKKDWLPDMLCKVNPHTHTPINATILITVLILVLALGFNLTILAQFTSFIILVVFAIVNLACMRVKIRDPHPKDVTIFPFAFSLLGFVTIVCFVGVRVWMAIF
ncbi:MAG: amino acid permease [Patescibacteria group bacterium]